jgi:calcineurin-like phosphoesterase family protein
MIRQIKLQGNEANIFFTSDLHYNHDPKWPVPLWKTRGYNSSTEHKEGLIAKWNERCMDSSVVFNLGDIVFQDPDGSIFRDLCSRLNYSVMYLLLGNHVSGHKKVYLEELAKQHPGAIDAATKEIKYEVYPLIYQVAAGKQVIFLPTYVEVVINHKPMVLSHYGIYSHNGEADYSWSLSGHSHQNNPETNWQTGKGYKLDVGVDGFGAPISMIEIRKLFEQQGRVVRPIDHHAPRS